MQVAPEAARQRVLDAHLLRREEALERALDGQVDVVGAHKVAQRHLGARLGHADDALEVAHGDRV
jgi:hypothetical protein